MITKRFDICKSYFFILPSVQIITTPPKLRHKDSEYKCSIEIDWLCFHLNFNILKKIKKGKIF